MFPVFLPISTAITAGLMFSGKSTLRRRSSSSMRLGTARKSEIELLTRESSGSTNRPSMAAYYAIFRVETGELEVID